MYKYIYIYVYIYIYIYIYAYVNTYKYRHPYIDIERQLLHIYIYIRICICIHIYIDILIDGVCVSRTSIALMIPPITIEEATNIRNDIAIGTRCWALSWCCPNLLGISTHRHVCGCPALLNQRLFVLWFVVGLDYSKFEFPIGLACL